MVLQIAGTMHSPPYQTALLTAIETGASYTIIPVDFLNGDSHLPKNVAYSLFGTVPYLIDDDFSLYESRAIARYIAAKQKSNLIPDVSDLKKMAKFEQAASVEQSFAPLILAVGLDAIWAPGLSDDAAKAKHLADLNKKLDVFETILSKQKYFAGDKLTLIDLFFLPFTTAVVEQGKFDFFPEATRPNLARWWKEISLRPFWQAVKTML